MKTRLLIVTMMALAAMWMPVQAQYTQTDRIARGVLEGINSVLDSQERKQKAEIHAREKAQYKPTFDATMDEARELEEDGNFADALTKYEEAAVLNWKYGYTDQRNITRKITSLYGPAGRTEEGPSVINNNIVTLPNYSGYRFMRENPIFKADKNAGSIKILRVCCSDTETRVEFEYENDEAKAIYVSVPSDTHIKAKKSGKLQLIQVQNVGVKPNKALIEQPYQKLRFALIFPPLSLEDSEFELKMPGKYWNFKKIPCK